MINKKFTAYLNPSFNKVRKELKQSFKSGVVIDLSHIPLADEDEQKEIEELLKNPDCHKFKKKNSSKIKIKF